MKLAIFEFVQFTTLSTKSLSTIRHLVTQNIILQSFRIYSSSNFGSGLFLFAHKSPSLMYAAKSMFRRNHGVGIKTLFLFK